MEGLVCVPSCLSFSPNATSFLMWRLAVLQVQTGAVRTVGTVCVVAVAISPYKPYLNKSFEPARSANFLNAGTFLSKAKPRGTGFSMSPISLISSSTSSRAKFVKW